MAVGRPLPRRRRLLFPPLLLLFVVKVAVGAAAVATVTAAAAGSQYVYPRECPRAPEIEVPSERGPLLGAAALDRFLASNYTVPGGEAIGFPPGLRLGCGDVLPRTDHIIECAPAWPVGGVVLRPKNVSRAAASVVFVHGLVGEPHLYLIALSALLQGDRDWWSAKRLVFPVAPAYKEFLKPPPNEEFYPGTGYGWYDPSGTDSVLSANDLKSLSTKEALVKALASGQSEDVAGFAATALRITAVACGEAGALRSSDGGGGGGGCGAPPVVILGHVRGGTAALGVAALAPVGLPRYWSGVVSLFGGAPLVPYVGRHGPSAVSATPASSYTVIAAGSGGKTPAVSMADAAYATAFWARLYGQRAVRQASLAKAGEREVLLVPAYKAKVVEAIREVLGEVGGAAERDGA